jgi:hypothetical protein
MIRRYCLIAVVVMSMISAKAHAQFMPIMSNPNANPMMMNPMLAMNPMMTNPMNPMMMNPMLAMNPMMTNPMNPMMMNPMFTMNPLMSNPPPVNPMLAMNPAMTMNPYAMNPYATNNPYAMNPFAMNPYAMNPTNTMYPTNPMYSSYPTYSMNPATNPLAQMYQMYPLVAQLATQPTQVGYSIGKLRFSSTMPAGMAMPGIFANPLTFMQPYGGLTQPSYAPNPPLMASLAPGGGGATGPVVLDLSGVDLDAVRR